MNYLEKSGEDLNENKTYNKRSDSKTISHGGVSVNSLFFSENGYSNHICFNVSVRFNNLISEQNPNRYSDKQLKIFKLIQSLHKDGLGYRRIAKVLNERGLTTEEGHIWKKYECLFGTKKIFRTTRTIEVQKEDISASSWKNVDGIY